MQAIISWILAIFCSVGCFFFGIFGTECPLTGLADRGGIVQIQPESFNITKSNVLALNLTVRKLTIRTENQVGTVRIREFTGVRFSEFLQAKGVDLNRLTTASKVRVDCADKETYTYSYAMFMDAKTLLTWQEDSEIFDTIRFSPGGTTGYNAYLFLKEVATITLYY
ncbi:MAG: hypothetical protein FWG82_01995 [Oscillospiraceae bacterium]|nr:hypothetical protein [Oscillospiraceae bacterium]